MYVAQSVPDASDRLTHALGVSPSSRESEDRGIHFLVAFSLSPNGWKAVRRIDTRMGQAEWISRLL
ncbi:hypothetical protein CBM2614_A270059 [Cupriavidus taiwanensis]|uniref:Uncharacterized protein n=1 Tax=Cupriavidus taiwanensis TaxID=164546 RepID=A0A375ECW8_9BURK|nr:hypothetical protein CBM2614_A270059 [Cupriavidus taiwanensis]SOZ70864.1 hypothetical protein CBM2613_B170303 [Cupriavidus taiwanensis]